MSDQTATVEAPVEEPKAPAIVTFQSEQYPSLKVLIGPGVKERGVANHYARFVAGRYSTADPDEIATLDKCRGVTRDSGVRYPCPNCGLKFWSAQHFAEHVVKHNTSEANK